MIGIRNILPWPTRCATSITMTRGPTSPGKHTLVPTWARWWVSRPNVTRLSPSPPSLYKSRPRPPAVVLFSTTALVSTAIEAVNAAVLPPEAQKSTRAGRRSGPTRPNKRPLAKGAAAHTRIGHKPRPMRTGLPRARRLAMCGVVGPGMTALGTDPITHGVAMNGRRGRLARAPSGRLRGDARPAHRPRSPVSGNGRNGAPGRPRKYPRESELDDRTPGIPGRRPRGQGGDQPRMGGGHHPRGAPRRLDGLDPGRRPPQPEDMEVAHHPFRTLDESRLVLAWRMVSLFSSCREPPWVGRRRGSVGK